MGTCLFVPQVLSQFLYICENKPHCEQLLCCPCLSLTQVFGTLLPDNLATFPTLPLPHPALPLRPHCHQMGPSTHNLPICVFLGNQI